MLVHQSNSASSCLLHIFTGMGPRMWFIVSSLSNSKPGSMAMSNLCSILATQTVCSRYEMFLPMQPRAPRICQLSKHRGNSSRQMQGGVGHSVVITCLTNCSLIKHLRHRLQMGEVTSEGG